MDIALTAKVLLACDCAGVRAYGMRPESKPRRTEREDCARHSRTEIERKGHGGRSARGLEQGQAPSTLIPRPEEQLLSLLGVTGAEADAVIAGVPTKNRDKLATRHILSPSQYGKISDRLTAKK